METANRREQLSQMFWFHLEGTRPNWSLHCGLRLSWLLVFSFHTYGNLCMGLYLADNYGLFLFVRLFLVPSTVYIIRSSSIRIFILAKVWLIWEDSREKMSLTLIYNSVSFLPSFCFSLLRGGTYLGSERQELCNLWLCKFILVIA